MGNLCESLLFGERRFVFYLKVLSNGWWPGGTFFGTGSVLGFGTTLICCVSKVPIGVFGLYGRILSLCSEDGAMPRACSV